jgi:exonuclease III
MIQNANSLNISSSVENWEIKVRSIMQQNKDIVFLSDLRLIRKDGLDITNKLKAALLTGTGRKYDLWENSTRRGRGVAILIARDLNCQVLDALEDIDENIVMLKIKLNGSLFIISSIYGPNSGSADFYENLDVFLTNLTGTETCDIILAGDWNTVVDNSPVKDNLDLLNMVTFPNQSNNARLLRLMDKWQLFDAFRIKKPYSKEFSYAPFGTSRNNRSRLDFFFDFGVPGPKAQRLLHLLRQTMQAFRSRFCGAGLGDQGYRIKNCK